VLGADQGSITPVGYPYWQRVSDWLMQRKYAVLTFDDGPTGNGVDERILAVLRHHHARAMFFLVCSHVDEAMSPVLRQIGRDGHIIGNHSFDHLQLSKLESTDLQHQIEDCSAQLATTTGHRPHFFRSPFGMSSPSVNRVAKASGMRQMLWNANSQDSWLVKPEQIRYWSSHQTDDDSILLLHERSTTAAVLDQVLTDLEQRGFIFVLPSDTPSDTDLS
jgi:peptidoglycan/xylan/chitin deacetylase (PgdA/CDA1 family)